MIAECASGRLQDLADVEKLESSPTQGEKPAIPGSND
jgi:hypothetical protein